ncbi:MAG: hypothetical protein WC435_03595 [Candidatus Paceibacterota bacterium]
MRKIKSSLNFLVILAVLFFASGLTYAATTDLKSGESVIVGTVKSTGGTVITISGRQGEPGKQGTETIYSINATEAAVQKVSSFVGKSKMTGTSISLSDIKIGDKLTVKGKLEGTNIMASEIIVGEANAPEIKNGEANTGEANTSEIKNGEAIGKERKEGTGIVGTVIAVSNNTFMLKSKETGEGKEKGATEIIYTVDASKAKITKGFGEGEKESSIVNIKIGDTLQVKGTITDLSIAATEISEFGKQGTATSTSEISETEKTKISFFSKVFNPIKNFFKKIFSRNK